MASCLPPTISFARFTEKIYKRILLEKIPFVGTIEVTSRCNLRCPFCYISHHHPKRELTYKQICRIIDEITEQGCLRLLLTGDEPFIRDDFLDIYSYAKKKGLIITIFTNGTLITPQTAEFLKEWPPHLIEISLYGITKETYENVTGVSGSFEKCMRGINLLIENNLPLNLKTLVTTLNKHELGSIKRFAKDLGIDYRYDPFINPAFDGSKEPCQFRLSPKDATDIEMAEKKVVNSWLEFHQQFKRQSFQPDERLFTCNIGQFSFYITADGRLKGCLLLEEPSYDLLQNSFKECWHRLSVEVRSLKRKKQSRCATCKIVTVCNQCPAWSQLEEGDRKKPVTYLCETAHLRAEALGIRKKEVSLQWQKKEEFRRSHITTLK